MLVEVADVDGVVCSGAYWVEASFLYFYSVPYYCGPFVAFPPCVSMPALVSRAAVLSAASPAVGAASAEPACFAVAGCHV